VPARSALEAGAATLHANLHGDPALTRAACNPNGSPAPIFPRSRRVQASFRMVP
jgi:hypothetical protein